MLQNVKPPGKWSLPLSIFLNQDGRQNGRQNTVFTTIDLVHKLIDRF